MCISKIVIIAKFSQSLLKYIYIYLIYYHIVISCPRCNESMHFQFVNRIGLKKLDWN